MSIESLSIEEIYKEIEARKQLEKAEIRKQLEEARKLVRELERKLGEPELVAPKVKSPKLRLTPAERSEKVFEALDGKGPISSGEIGVLTGIAYMQLRETLNTLISEGLVEKSGESRGTKYKLKTN